MAGPYSASSLHLRPPAMPPRKGIVKSGNAGNSSKASPITIAGPGGKSGAAAGSSPAVGPVSEAKSLFPPGSKFPLSLLNERCQKNGWDKPIIDTFQRGKGWSFSVRLSRDNKKTHQKDVVKMEPHPAYICPSAIEARHWGATYALYRFCNGIQLNRVLPPGPRDYWNTLAAEHKAVPEHQQWMYADDPFKAKKEVEERQAKATERREAAAQPAEAVEAHRGGSSAIDDHRIPEVVMVGSLRELVEDAVKKGFALHPELQDLSEEGLSDDARVTLQKQLSQIGFNKHQVERAWKFLEKPDLAVSSTNSPLDAAVEYLLLTIPECDLPNRYKHGNASSVPFVTSAHSSSSDLKTRWIQDRAVKEAGFPDHLVCQCLLGDASLGGDWPRLLATLGDRLIDGRNLPSDPEPLIVDEEEATALGADIVASTEETYKTVVLPLFSDPDTKVHIVADQASACPRTDFVPAYITSPNLPPYVRLQLLACLLRFVRSPEARESGLYMGALQAVDGEWVRVQQEGPPSVGDVLKHIQAGPVPNLLKDIETQKSRPARQKKYGNRPQKSSEELRAGLERVHQAEKYKALLKTRERLPAFKARDRFLDLLAKNQVLVVVGKTGSGKTTQLPQFILDALILANQGKDTSIIITQPRRLSAVSVAQRVSVERLDDGSVGYSIRGESTSTRDTKLLFCTTGVILRRLASVEGLRGVTHVVVDEVHERSIDSDFLLRELKDLLAQKMSIKVVLMSATVDHERFVQYFNGAPLLSISGLAHPVTDLYLEDIVPQIDYRPPAPPPSKQNVENVRQQERDKWKQRGLCDAAALAIQVIAESDRIDYALVASVVKHIVRRSDAKPCGILIFLPGVQEIKQCLEAVQREVPHKEADILPLHANLSGDEQARVFAKTSKWKVIAATNVAETSITIDDVVYVVDCGRVKETGYDPATDMSRLQEGWVTRAAAQQRRGRAGRTRPGFCYKLFTRDREARMAPFPMPEIQRVPLESVCLAVKAAREHEDPRAFLAGMISPPNVATMNRAMATLEELGALTREGALTPLGSNMAILPVDVRIAKMLILAALFRCLSPILTVAAILSSKPVFLNPPDQRDEADLARQRFAIYGSDLLASVLAYDECMRLRSSGKTQREIVEFCKQNFISPTTVREITTLRLEFHNALSSMGFIPPSLPPTAPALNAYSTHTNLLKGIALAGLYPRVARVRAPRAKFDAVAAGAVQRDAAAREFAFFDMRDERVWLHPGSTLFGEARWAAPFAAYFSRVKTGKVYVREVTEAPTYALLLFGGHVSVDAVRGALTVGDRDREGFIRLKAWARIGVLVNHLRRLLDARLLLCVEDTSQMQAGPDDAVLNAMLSLLANDGRDPKDARPFDVQYLSPAPSSSLATASRRPEASAGKGR
ncbi:P-loop containing nucleoside triphosphate hydrolase protein [Schizophyllum amplum]|uniref:RNA helicase n=1 Tax=Schizophyllum amplum TaxID=97359 RepID=A0A550CN95_9AGAR|nr:P-loop containing nucleoside triphosphate hydrolase protein [Auriculariopsis ampla]